MKIRNLALNKIKKNVLEVGYVSRSLKYQCSKRYGVMCDKTYKTTIIYIYVVMCIDILHILHILLKTCNYVIK